MEFLPPLHQTQNRQLKKGGSTAVTDLKVQIWATLMILTVSVGQKSEQRLRQRSPNIFFNASYNLVEKPKIVALFNLQCCQVKRVFTCFHCEYLSAEFS